MSANRYLAELKGVAGTIPNESILINTLVLQEAKESSAIENIVTTEDSLFKAELFQNQAGIAEKEVQNYVRALHTGFKKVFDEQLLLNKHILQVQEILEENNAGFRHNKGTSLVSSNTGEIVYTPPQDYEQILDLMSNFEQTVNDDEYWDIDHLIKMAVLHFQFESIHPFYDGNGRTGRIINILYLVNKGLLQIPILYLSRYIVKHKQEYYRLLQGVRDNNDWERWILFVLDGVEKTAISTIEKINNIRSLMMEYKHGIRSMNSKIYSQDLINNIFKHPYTKIQFLEKDIGVSRVTATKYLDFLAKNHYLTKHRKGKFVYYVNARLLDILLN